MNLKYRFSKELYEQINSNFGGQGFSGFNIGYIVDEENEIYEIEKWYVEKLINELEGFNDWFFDNFSKSAISKLSENTIHPFRILNLVSDEFKNYPIENIDFTVHLKPDVALNKTNIEFDTRGRPIKVDYEFEGTLYARRTFEFNLNSETFFPERRREFLAYYREDEQLGDLFLIKDKKFDSQTEFDQILNELEMARTNNIKKVKLLILKNIEVADPTKTFEEILFQAGEFLDDYSKTISNFIQSGIAKTPNGGDKRYIIDKIIDDVTNSPAKYPFLNEPYFADTNYKLYQIIISILDY
jgi:hypothetical protein